MDLVILEDELLNRDNRKKLMSTLMLEGESRLKSWPIWRTIFLWVLKFSSEDRILIVENEAGRLKLSYQINKMRHKRLGCPKISIKSNLGYPS